MKLIEMENPPKDFIFDRAPEYRELGQNEALEKGDEYWTQGKWIKTITQGTLVKFMGTGNKYRRKVHKEENEFVI